MERQRERERVFVKGQFVKKKQTRTPTFTFKAVVWWMRVQVGS